MNCFSNIPFQKYKQQTNKQINKQNIIQRYLTMHGKVKNILQGSETQNLLKKRNLMFKN